MLFVLRSLVYTMHALAAGVWIGGSLVYLVVITRRCASARRRLKWARRWRGCFGRW